MIDRTVPSPTPARVLVAAGVLAIVAGLTLAPRVIARPVRAIVIEAQVVVGAALETAAVSPSRSAAVSTSTRAAAGRAASGRAISSPFGPGMGPVYRRRM